MTRVELNAVEEFHDGVKWGTELFYEPIGDQFTVTIKYPCAWVLIWDGDDGKGYPSNVFSGGYTIKPVEWETKEFFNMHAAIAFIDHKETQLKRR